jgi:hypothetical protein
MDPEEWIQEGVDEGDESRRVDWEGGSRGVDCWGMDLEEWIVMVDNEKSGSWGWMGGSLGVDWRELEELIGWGVGWIRS